MKTKTSNKIPVKKPPLKKGDFIKISEIKKSRYSRDVFFGVLSSIGSGSATAYVTTEKEPSSITIEHFDFEEYQVEEAREDEVIQYFTYALHSRKRKVEEISFDLESEKRRLERTQMAYSLVFGSER